MSVPISLIYFSEKLVALIMHIYIILSCLLNHESLPSFFKWEFFYYYYWKWGQTQTQLQSLLKETPIMSCIIISIILAEAQSNS